MPAEGKEFAAPDYENLLHALCGLYTREVAPVEAALKYAAVGTASYTAAEFDAKPTVFILGQYSVGKTTFIRSLLGKDFPSMQIGPEPTTDCFMAIEKGASDRNVPGSAATADTTRPWGALGSFGAAFQAKFSVTSVCDAPLLDDLCLVDSPGVLAGEKQKQAGRHYDFVEVASHFAERADLILVLVDAHKLDLSDEFTNVLRAIQKHDEKLRVVLNKADQVSTQELIRVTTAMAWSLSRCLKTPEVKRVYVSSFWDEPLKNPQLAPFFDDERASLLADLRQLPQGQLQRRTNEVLRRIAAVKAHATVLDGIRKRVPIFGQEAWAKSCADGSALPDLWQQIAKDNEVPLWNLPPIDHYRDAIAGGKLDVLKLPATKNAVAALDRAAAAHVPHAQRYFRADLEELPEEAPRIVKTFLYKLDGKHKFKLTSAGYKKRWFVLDKSLLKYYHARDQSGNDGPNAAGELDLLGCTCAALPDSDRSFAFSIDGPKLDRTFVLAAENNEDMATWIKQIRAHASGRPQVPTATPVPSEPTIQVPSEPVQAELAPAEAVAEAADDDGPGDAGGGEFRMSITGASGEETTVDGLIV